MKYLITLAFVSVYLINLFSQDTLSCKTDLEWNKTEKLYYLKNGNPTKTYTGPATCEPQKNVINKGYLKNGMWEGRVYGFKLGIPLGYVTFKEGIRHGAEVRRNEQGITTDSIHFEFGKPVYVYQLKFDKYKYLTSEYRLDLVKDTSIFLEYSFDFETNNPYVIQITRRKGKALNGEQAFFSNAYDEGKVFSQIDKNELYLNGIIQKTYLYSEGILEEELIYENGKHVNTLIYDISTKTVIEKIAYKNGKKDGLAITYGENGQVLMETLYAKGKLVKIME
jgi:antitoxin component YwqK of YwqJK toxin-antitoxin module